MDAECKRLQYMMLSVWESHGDLNSCQSVGPVILLVDVLPLPFLTLWQRKLH